MDFFTLTLLFIACYALYSYIYKCNNYFKDLGIPYVPSVPLLGNMAAVTLRRKHVTENTKDLYNYLPNAKYVGVFNFTTPTILVRDPELIKSIAIKHFDNFADHLFYIDDTVDPLMAGNLFAMTGDRWREARNLLSPAFTSSKMKSMFELMVQCIENFMNYIAQQGEDPKNIIDAKDLFTKYSNDVIASCAFGINIDSLKDPNNDFYRSGKEATNFDGILSLKVFMARSFPLLMKIFKIRIVSNHIKDFFMDIVKRSIEMRDANGISRPDMLQLMMEARGKSHDHLKLDIAEMTAQAFVFFFAGFDTTSTQMCIIAQELTTNPEIQERLQSEIDDVLTETNGKPTYEAINAMSYLDAVFNESMRRHPQGDVVDRLCTKAFEFPPALPGGKPFVVHPGMNIWIPTAAIHHDERYYENPKKFDPDRYLDKKVTINQVENLGFGIGPRGCIGNRFAILETKVVFFYLLSKFSLKPNAKTNKLFEYSTSTITVVPKGGYWLTVEPRSNKVNL